MKLEQELMRGAGPLAVMQLLASGEKYGYELVQRLDQDTRGVLAMGQSTLYPMLYNLQAKGVITSRIKKVGGRDRRYYSLTGRGRKKLTKDTKQAQGMVEALVALGLVRVGQGGI